MCFITKTEGSTAFTFHAFTWFIFYCHFTYCTEKYQTNWEYKWEFFENWQLHKNKNFTHHFRERDKMLTWATTHMSILLILLPAKTDSFHFHREMSSVVLFSEYCRASFIYILENELEIFRWFSKEISIIHINIGIKYANTVKWTLHLAILRGIVMLLLLVVFLLLMAFASLLLTFLTQKNTKLHYLAFKRSQCIISSRKFETLCVYNRLYSTLIRN